MSATNQQNVMQFYESVVPPRGSFPCRPATVDVIVAAPSWWKQAERRVDHVQAQDSGADLRRSAWMAKAQAGDGIAYQALLRDCIPIIKSIARRRGVSADRIDDVVQDVLLTIHRARQTYDPSRSFTAWLAVIADRRAIISSAVFAGRKHARCTHRSRSKAMPMKWPIQRADSLTPTRLPQSHARSRACRRASARRCSASCWTSARSPTPPR
jgi:DNA-directed RNA polymerase specialized sigma24 family protein